MPQLNFSHNKKLTEYAYDIIVNLREMLAIFEVEQPEVYNLWDAAEQVMNAQFIMLADVTGIEMYEKFLKITPRFDESLDERRADVLSAFQDSLPYTRKNFLNLVNALKIPADYIKISYPDNFHLNVEIAGEYANLINFLTHLIERMTPYTMQNLVKLREYTWGEAKPQMWRHLPEKTWGEFLNNPY